MEAECAVCLQFYDEDGDHTPRVLSCGHSVCHSCLADLRAHWAGAGTKAGSGLVQCPECKQHTRVPLGGLAALPRNFELMRLIQGGRSRVDGEQAERPMQRVKRLTDPTTPWLVAEFAYGEPAVWVLPESSIRARKGIVGGLCVGEFWRDESFQSVSLEFLANGGDVRSRNYEERVRFSWESLRGEKRSRLMRLIGLSLRCNRFAEVFGLWGSEEGGLYLVSKVWAEGIEQARRLISPGSGDGGGEGGGMEEGGGGTRRSVVSEKSLIRLGLEVCEIVMEIHAGEIRVGILEVDSFALDAYGHVQLLVGKCLSCRRSGSNSNECVSPEVVEVLKKLEGGEKAAAGASSYGSEDEAGNETDVYSLACVLLQLLREVLDRNERFKELLLSCMASVPSNRPRVVDLWWELKGLLEDQAVGAMPSHFAEGIAEDNLGQVMSESEADTVQEPETPPDNPPRLARALIDVKQCNNIGVKTLQGHMDTVSCLSVCGNNLISAAFDKTLRVWSLDDYRLVRTFTGHEQRITAVAVHEASELCVSGDYGGQICAWSIASTGNAALVATWQVHQDWRYSGVASLAISCDELLYSGSGDRTIKAWSTLGFEHVATMEGHKGAVSVLMVEGQILFSGSWDGTIRLWWRPDHSPLTSFGGRSSVPLGGIRALVKCPANGLLFSGHDSGVIQIWNEEECMGTLKAHTGVVSALAFDQDWLYSSSWDGFVKAWPLDDILSGTANPVEKCDQAAVTALCCSAQDKLFAAVKQEIQVYCP